MDRERPTDHGEPTSLGRYRSGKSTAPGLRSGLKPAHQRRVKAGVGSHGKTVYNETVGMDPRASQSHRIGVKCPGCPTRHTSHKRRGREWPVGESVSYGPAASISGEDGNGPMDRSTRPHDIIDV